MEFKLFILGNFYILEDIIYYVDIFQLKFDKLNKENEEGVRGKLFIWRLKMLFESQLVLDIEWKLFVK